MNKSMNLYISIGWTWSIKLLAPISSKTCCNTYKDNTNLLETTQIFINFTTDLQSLLVCTLQSELLDQACKQLCSCSRFLPRQKQQNWQSFPPCPRQNANSKKRNGEVKPVKEKTRETSSRRGGMEIARRLKPVVSSGDVSVVLASFAVMAQ